MKMTRYILSVILAAAWVPSLRAATPTEWAVKDAPLRFVANLMIDPSHPSAGYFMTLPDGGILPGPAPEPVIFDEAGNPLVSAVLWHCPDTGCGIVFQKPKAGRSVTIYVRGAKALKLWTPKSGLTPSPLLCEIHGATTQRAASQAGELGVVGPKVLFSNQAWSAGKWRGEKVPLAFQPWRPGGSAIYMLAYLNVTDPGPTWVAPLTQAGQMDVAIAGQMLRFTKKNEKRGGIGATVSLTAGLHEVELYGYNTSGGPTGPLSLTWRPPGAKMEELGGARPSDLRYPGTAMFESRLVKDSETVKSGESVIQDVQSQDGGPIACFAALPQNVFWFEGEDPMIQYVLKAEANSNPKGTQYSWGFDSDPGALATGSEVNWLLKGDDYSWVTLTAEADGKKSVSHSPLYPHSTTKSSINNAETRKAFRLSCLTILKAFPDKSDPVAKWEPCMWNNFFRVLELQPKNTLVEYVVTQRWSFFRKKIDADKKALIEDLFLFSMGEREPKVAMEWVDEFCKDAPNHARSVVLQLKKAEIMMYYLNDLEGARKIITPFLADSSEGGEWARIRMGDLEMLSRNLNEATQRYGDVQTRSKGGSVGAPLVKKPREPSFSGPVLVAEAARQKAALKAAQKGTGKKADEIEAPSNVAAWKLAAIRDVAASENVGSLIEQGFYLEASQALKTWERSFPMTKISGDYILREAKLHMELTDYKRARAILTAYCDQVDTSNFLPEALKMIKSCMIFMNEPEAEVAKYEKEILKRTQFGSDE